MELDLGCSFREIALEVTSSPAFPNIVWHTFCHSYPDKFEDTNNLSVVTFLDLHSTRFLIPGDLEKPGWENFLHNRNFVELLKGVDVFIASHHGRESGYCSNVFRYCHPNVVIISDGPKEHATQEMVGTYANHAQGISFNGQTRYVLTTRTDGALIWEF